MKEYYYLENRNQKGPFTVEEMRTQKLSGETLIWSEGMDNWQKLKDVAELFQEIKLKIIPPPPPSEIEINKTEISGHLNVTSEKVPNPAVEKIKPSQNALIFIIIWCSFHLFALLMSYSQIKIFNNHGTPSTSEFWPFVHYNNNHGELERDPNGEEYTDENTGLKERYSKPHEFDGIFVDYDWTEFAVYVGGAFLIYLLIKISSKNEIA